MKSSLSVASAPKTATFQMRINPEIKKEVEDLYAASGMTFTDAVNAFIQQSLNVGGLPFLVPDSLQALPLRSFIRPSVPSSKNMRSHFFKKKKSLDFFSGKYLLIVSL